MIWIAKDLDHITPEHPEWIGPKMTLAGRVYRKLNPRMFAALHSSMLKRASMDVLTREEIERFTALEETIDALGLKGEYYADVAKEA